MKAMAGFLFVTFYASMAAAALLVELLFAALGLIPQQRNALVVEATIAWNYTTWLNIAFLALAAYLVWRFVRTGGVPMLRKMNRPALIEVGAVPASVPDRLVLAAGAIGRKLSTFRPMRNFVN